MLLSHENSYFVQTTWRLGLYWICLSQHYAKLGLHWVIVFAPQFQPELIRWGKSLLLDWVNLSRPMHLSNGLFVLWCGWVYIICFARYGTTTPSSSGQINNMKSKSLTSPKWRRVVFKISGAALTGTGPHSIDPKVCYSILLAMLLVSNKFCSQSQQFNHFSQVVEL